jgi:hypothetical protein
MDRILAERWRGVYQRGDFIAVTLRDKPKTFLVRCQDHFAKELMTKPMSNTL